MKCPKCGYLGFEASDRCRNCGYEFALAVREADSSAIDVSSPPVSDGPLADLMLTSAPLASERRKATPSRELDLDRIIGAPDPAADLPLFDAPAAGETPLPSRPPAAARPPLPAPATPRRPLSVRRATPDPARFRSHDPVPRPGRTLDLPLPSERLTAGRSASDAPEGAAAAPRLFAALTDAGLLLAIDALVLYFTLRLCSLGFGDLRLLPIVPLAAFFLLLNGGYLLAFTAATGQTIGKMALGLKVVGRDREMTALTAAVRSAGCLLTAVTLGAGLIPALLGGRALHDRLAGTAVVHVRE